MPSIDNQRSFTSAKGTLPPQQAVGYVTVTIVTHIIEASFGELDPRNLKRVIVSSRSLPVVDTSLIVSSRLPDRANTR